MADDLATFREGLARRRRAGEPFDSAWDAEVAALPPPEQRWDALLDEAVLSCRSSWRRAYEREPATRLDLVGRRLTGLLEDPGGGLVA